MEAFLDELACRTEGGLVVELPRLPGSRENRWAHLLSGPVSIEAPAGGRSVVGGSSQEMEQQHVQLRARVDALESEVSELRALLAELANR